MSGGAALQEEFKIVFNEAFKEIDENEEKKVDGQAKAS